MASTKITTPTSPLPPSSTSPSTSSAQSPTPLSSLLSGSAAVNTCSTCLQPITDSQFIRVSSFKFHKAHFLCSVCSVNLHGSKFHHKEGAFYCPQHYMDKFCHSCRHCGEKIGSGSMIAAFGHYYHPEHFVCRQCGCGFVNGKYYESEDFPYCEQHFQELTLDKCSKCQLPVKQDEASRLGSQLFHAHCLSCFHCGLALGEKGGQAFSKDGRIYCQKDYLQLYCKRCTRCGDYLVKNMISVNGEFYHQACLQCDVCSKQLDKYICVNGHLRCSEHADQKGGNFTCAQCHAEIEEGKEVLLAVGRQFHSFCFNCQLCNRALDKATCKLRDNKVCCPECLLKDSVGDREQQQQGKRRTQQQLTVDASKQPDESKSPDSGRRNPTSAASGSLATRKTTRSTTGPSPASSSSSSSSSASASSSSSASSFSSSSSLLSSSAPPLPAPPKIDWKKGDLIGKGSFGKVYMGMNIGTGELIAVKQVRLLTSEELEQATAIQNEISLMENLRHPNIVCFLGTQRSGNKLNILMEYVPGKSLDFLLDKFGALYEKVIRSYTKQLLGALQYCHSNHVVHRDIKGKNILIDTKGNLKLADFGSAKRFENVMSKDAPSLSYNYTPLWTAPEVLTGDYNSAVDIWSLGCVIIEMASAKPPWSEQNFENPFRALYHIGNSDAIPAIPDTLSEEGQAFVKLCLTRDPDKRPSASEMLKHDWVRGLDTEEVALVTGREDGGSGDEADSDREFDDDDEDTDEDTTADDRREEAKSRQ